MNSLNSTLFSKVRYYLNLSREIQLSLSKNPRDLSKFQKIFDSTVEQISVDILEFERENITKSESEVYRLKRIFEKRYKNHFLYGDLTRWTYEKPLGYAGDFKIIEDIYKNNPTTVGFDGLWDRYFLQMSASRATRKRKDRLKEIMLEFVCSHQGRDIRIMSLGSGSSREIKELLENDSGYLFSKVIFDCYDYDIRAINYARDIVGNASKVNFFQKNAIRLALKKDIKEEIKNSYDLIYSAGLFDYLSEKIAVKLVSNLKRVLKKEGDIVLVNFGDKYNNSSAGLMEWVTEWYLIYRTEEELMDIFLNAGFLSRNLKLISQPDKVILYGFASAE